MLLDLRGERQRDVLVQALRCGAGAHDHRWSAGEVEGFGVAVRDLLDPRLRAADCRLGAGRTAIDVY